jgi:hypothetical protein
MDKLEIKQGSFIQQNQYFIIRNLRNALMNGNINIRNIRTRITPERTRKNYRISIWRQI